MGGLGVWLPRMLIWLLVRLVIYTDVWPPSPTRHLLAMYVIGWLPVIGWLTGWLTTKLAGFVAGWQYGWLALRLISYIGGWVAGMRQPLAGYTATHLALQPADLLIGFSYINN